MTSGPSSALLLWTSSLRLVVPNTGEGKVYFSLFLPKTTLLPTPADVCEGLVSSPCDFCSCSGSLDKRNGTFDVPFRHFLKKRKPSIPFTLLTARASSRPNHPNVHSSATCATCCSASNHSFAAPRLRTLLRTVIGRNSTPASAQRSRPARRPAARWLLTSPRFVGGGGRPCAAHYF